MAYFVILVIVGLASFKPAWMSTDILLWAIVGGIALARAQDGLQSLRKKFHLLEQLACLFRLVRRPVIYGTSTGQFIT